MFVLFEELIARVIPLVQFNLFLKNLLFNDALNCHVYAVSVTGELLWRICDVTQQKIEVLREIP